VDRSERDGVVIVGKDVVQLDTGPCPESSKIRPNSSIT